MSFYTVVLICLLLLGVNVLIFAAVLSPVARFFRIRDVTFETALVASLLLSAV